MVLIVSHVNRFHVSRHDYSIYVHTTFIILSEKHLDEDTKELSKFEEWFYINMLDLKAAALGNMNLSDLESHIIILSFAYVRRK
jgi:hypothetical protein